jgi:hypothetical protein
LQATSYSIKVPTLRDAQVTRRIYNARRHKCCYGAGDGCFESI